MGREIQGTGLAAEVNVAVVVEVQEMRLGLLLATADEAGRHQLQVGGKPGDVTVGRDRGGRAVVGGIEGARRHREVVAVGASGDIHGKPLAGSVHGHDPGDIGVIGRAEHGVGLELGKAGIESRDVVVERRFWVKLGFDVWKFETGGDAAVAREIDAVPVW